MSFSLNYNIILSVWMNKKFLILRLTLGFCILQNKFLVESVPVFVILQIHFLCCFKDELRFLAGRNYTIYTFASGSDILCCSYFLYQGFWPSVFENVPSLRAVLWVLVFFLSFFFLTCGDKLNILAVLIFPFLLKFSYLYMLLDTQCKLGSCISSSDPQLPGSRRLLWTLSEVLRS